MILIRFDDPEMEKRALGWLAARFSIKTWSDGETLVPAGALPHLAAAGFVFTVAGRPTYDRSHASLRDPAPAAV